MKLPPMIADCLRGERDAEQFECSALHFGWRGQQDIEQRWPSWTTFRVMVARSASSVRKLWTGSGSPCAVSVICWLPCNARPARLALATGEVRCASRPVDRARRTAWARGATHMPFEMIGEHAEQHVGAHTRRGPVVHRAQLQIDGFIDRKAARRRRGSCTPHGGSGIGLRRRQIGAHHVDAIERGFGGDGGLVPGEAERVIGDRMMKCLAILRWPSTAPSAVPIAPAHAAAYLLAVPGPMRARSFSVAPAAHRAYASFAAQRVLADHQALTGVVGAGDLCHIAMIEQRGLQRPTVSGQRLDRRGTQRGDPSSPAGRSAGSMRASVSMPRSPTITTRCRLKRWLSLSICAASVIGSAVLPSNTSIATGQPFAAQQADHQLRTVAPVIATVAETSELAAAPFQVGGRHIIEQQRTVRQMTSRQRGLDETLL